MLNQPKYSHLSELGIAGVAYDVMWSIALGLDITSKKVASGNDSGCSHLSGDLVPLEMFEYSNEKLGCVMAQSLDEVKFTGVTVNNSNFCNKNWMDNFSFRNNLSTLMEVLWILFCCLIKTE